MAKKFNTRKRSHVSEARGCAKFYVRVEEESELLIQIFYFTCLHEELNSPFARI